MYTVFLVEDEPLIRANMRNAIENSGEPFSCIGEAGDGELALTIIQDLKPDILITDIKMPFMDGLTLARHAKAIIPWLRVIIVSGYDDFDLARQAIDIGVDQYILKPTPNKDLFAALHVASEKIAEHKKQSVSFLKHQSNDEMVKNTLIGSFLEQLCNGEIGADEALRRADELETGLLSKSYAVAIAQYEGKNGYPNRLTITSKAKYALRNDPEVLFFMSGADHVVLIVKGPTDIDATGKAYHAAQTLKHEIEDDGSTKLTVGISAVTNRITGIHDAYREAGVLLKTFAQTHRSRIFCSGDLCRGDASVVPAIDDLFDADVENKLKFATPQDVPAIVAEFAKSIDTDEMQSLLYRYYILMDLTAAATRIIRNFNPSMAQAELSRHFASRKDVFSSAISAQEFTDLATKICLKFIELRDSGNSCHHKKIVQKACDFIKENFNTPDISLNTVAAHVSLSPTHFSTIFAQEMSVTFIDYLTGARMEKVKELLVTTDEKIVSIAFSVGYNEPNYLSYIFKKREGLTPKEYRTMKKAKAE
ncbi:response regulator [Treponema zuelzerae]|uniref:Response regulator n=1 Tax=Teretinema zuelzerae TaxID=156 RepID=A0AAE3JJV5_9SPIR|nr:response regulator [Teretinema zuelzerae]MCD1653369.1 response regulator [Teretinema zuelzerae]